VVVLVVLVDVELQHQLQVLLLEEVVVELEELVEEHPRHLCLLVVELVEFLQPQEVIIQAVVVELLHLQEVIQQQVDLE
jgi:hypothetical protein